MAIDDKALEALTIPELEALIPRVERAIRTRKEQQKVELYERMKEMAAAEGLSLSEVIGGLPAAGRARRRSATTVRQPRSGYSHPSDPGLTWSGRGRRPKWVAEWEMAHGSLEGLPRG